MQRFILFCFGLAFSCHLHAQNWLNISTTGPNWINCGTINVTGNQITVEALITTTAASAGENIVSKHTNPGDDNYLLRPGDFEIGTSNGFFVVSNSYPLAMNKTYHVAAVYDGAFIYYYVNGCQTGKTACTGTMIQNTLLTAIGNQSACQCEPFTGYIDEVRIWNTARSPAQLQANMNTLPTPATQAGLLAYYNMNAGYTNQQGNAAFDGTPVGSCSFSTNPYDTTPLLPFNASLSFQNIRCNGTSTGSVLANAQGGNPAYIYSLNGGAGQSAGSFTGLAANSYTVTVTSSEGGCVQQLPFTITQPPALSLLGSTHPAYCGKNDGTATAQASGGTGTITYSWTPAGSGSGLASYNNIAAGSYLLHIHDSLGCADSISLIVGSKTGVSATFSSGTNPRCYQGSDGSLSLQASGGSPAFTYSWTPAPGGGQGTSTATGLSAGTYTCIVADSAGCLSQVSTALKEPSQVGVTPMPSKTLCVSNCTSLTATANGGNFSYSYSWTLNAAASPDTVCPLVSTTYTVVAVDSNKCSSLPAKVTISVNPPLEISASAGSAVCPGTAASLQSLASGGNSSYTYSWFPAGGLSATSGANVQASPPANASYTVTVSDNCGSTTDSAVVLVSVYASPTVSVLASDTSGCEPFCISFNQNAQPACAAVAWNFGDGQTASGCGTQKHCYQSSGNYTVQVDLKDIHGCKTSVNKNSWIKILPSPKPVFEADPQPASIINPEISFMNLTTDSCTWLWKFGDPGQDTSVLKNPLFTYADTGCYQVSLFAVNSAGCTDSIKKKVCILPEFIFYAPNAFTPNADGLNDIWIPKGEDIDPKNYSLLIYDRWGELVFSTTTWGEGWDGKMMKSTNFAPSDVYVWRVDLKDFSERTHILKGLCVLIR
jgi:gliding motility-associated-like protein